MRKKGYNRLLSDIPAMSEAMPTKTDIYARIADEIRNISPDVVDSLNKVIEELNRSNRWHVYFAVKKFIERNGIATADFGFLGIPNRFIGDVFSPCDIVIYAMPQMLKTDDIVLAFDLSNGGMSMRYCRVQRIMLATGIIDAIHIETNKSMVISTRQILGKVLRSIELGTREWHESIKEIVLKAKLVETMTEAVSYYSQQASTSVDRKKELEKRLQTIQSLP